MISKEDLALLIKIANMARKCKYFTFSERMFQCLNYAYPLMAFPHVGLGMTFFETGRHARACSEFEEVMQLGDKNKDVYFAYGLCQIACGNYKKSVEALHQAMAMEKNEGGSNIVQSANDLLALPEMKLLHLSYLNGGH